MERFSDRVGATKAPDFLILNDATAALRTSIWNLYFQLYDHTYWFDVCRRYALHIEPFPIDQIYPAADSLRRWLKERLFKCEWYVFFNHLEQLSKTHPRSGFTNQRDDTIIAQHAISSAEFMNFANTILHDRYSGYRFVGGTLSAITDPAEVESVGNAATQLASVGLPAAQKHIREALLLFSRKPTPDFRNAIKEAISAIESIAKQVSGITGGGLAGPLNELASQVRIHPSLHSAYKMIYGYASDEKGVRHAMLDDDPNVGFDEAKYMIVSCSAFANYLAAKVDAAGLRAKPK